MLNLGNKDSLCKCGNKLYKRNGIVISKLCSRCKKEKEELKKEKHKLTKTYEESENKKLMRKADRLYQELGRLKYSECYFGHNEYSCLHHFIRKSQSLNTRYNLDNGIPVCSHCHASIHMGENSELEGLLVIQKGDKWLSNLISEKHKVVENKHQFLLDNIERLQSLIKA